MFDEDDCAESEVNEDGKGIDVSGPCPHCGRQAWFTIPWSAIVRMYRREPVHPWATLSDGYRIGFQCAACRSLGPKIGWIQLEIGQDEVCQWEAIRAEQQLGVRR